MAKDIDSLMVCGFMFDARMERVLLIEKNRPKRQTGRLNGIGGHVKEGETEQDAMRREFQEEAGVNVPEWQRVCVVSGRGWTVTFFALANEHAYEAAEPKTDEALVRVSVAKLPKRVINNLNWLIPMAVRVLTT